MKFEQLTIIGSGESHLKISTAGRNFSPPNKLTMVGAKTHKIKLKNIEMMNIILLMEPLPDMVMMFIKHRFGFDLVP